MSMFCNQCQEAAKNVGCTVKGVCGKTDAVSNLQDLLIYNLRGIANLIKKSEKFGINIIKNEKNINNFIIESLFSTITNVNFDERYFINKIEEGLKIKEKYKNDLLKEAEKQGAYIDDELTDDSKWQSSSHEEIYVKSAEIKNFASKNEDIKSLKELLLYGIKGMAAYYHHANVLKYEDNEIIHFIINGLSAISNFAISIDDLLRLVLDCGKYGVQTMALLDKANTSNYGNPEPTEVKIGVGANPGILISGHDLKDLEELLEQTKGTGIDVYTHGEMLPAHYYPEFKKYDNFVGNYGSAWYNQVEDFEKFNGPVLMTTNCLIPPKEKYKDRVYTTGTAGFPDLKHINDRINGKQKDFSLIIDHAKKCQPPTELETGTITGGFAHNIVLSTADKILDAINTKKIKNFVVMAGCDGRHKSREYYTDFAEKLPKDSIILTAGCAKFRYNKLNLGDIGGIPRILDAGQCNDSYSLAVVALKLAEVLNVNINDLPIIYNIAWYEQKAVIVLLALLYLGVKKIHLGPTLPAFLSPNVAKVLVEKFEISPISNVEDDISKFFELI